MCLAAAASFRPSRRARGRRAATAPGRDRGPSARCCEASSGASPRAQGERCDEGLAQLRVAVLVLERTLVIVGCLAGREVLTLTAGQRQRGPAIPGLSP